MNQAKIIVASVLFIFCFTAASYCMLDQLRHAPVSSNSTINSTSTPPTNVSTSVNVVSPAPSSWNTYINDTHALSFQYPADYKITKIVHEGNPSNVVGVIPADKTRHDDFIQIVLPGDLGMDSLNAHARTLADYETDYVSMLWSEAGRNISIESSERMVINGREVLKQTYSVTPIHSYDDFGMDGGTSYRYIFDNHGTFAVMAQWGGYAKTEMLDAIAETLVFFDDRTLLTMENRGEVLPNDILEVCNLEWNTEKPNTVKHYVNSDGTFEMDVPVNEGWGNDEFRILPYEERIDGIFFGTVRRGEGCGPVREYVLHVAPSRSIYDIVEIFKNDSAYPEGYTETIQATVVSGYTAYEYLEIGLCTTPVIEIVGPTQNYRLSPLCGGEMSDLEHIAQSIVIR